MQGFLRSDGRKGIRNVVAVAYLVECAHHVAREIALPLREQGVHLIGFPGCYPNAYAARIMRQLCTHPNVGAVLWSRWAARASTADRWPRDPASGRPVETLVIQEGGGTARTIEHGRDWVRQARWLETRAVAPCRDGRRRVGRGHDLRRLRRHQRADRKSGRRPGLRSAGPAGSGLHLRGDRRADRLRAVHGPARRHARTGPARSSPCVAKAARYYRTLGHSSFAPGNAEGGLDDHRREIAGRPMPRAATRGSPG